MSARSRGTLHDDMNLSLTGSQISVKKSGAKLHRPSSVTDVRTSSKGEGHKNSKKNPSHGLQQLSHRSERSDVSSVSRASSRKGKSPSDDFLALFESSMQPKIKTPSAKKPGPNAVKVLWNDPPKRGSKIDSQRSTNSQLSALDDNFKQHNFFQPGSARSSDSEDDILSSSLNKIKILQAKEKPVSNHSNQKTSNNSLNHLGSYNGIANNMVVSVKSPKASLSSIENSYQNIKHKTPVNQVKGGMSNSSNKIDKNRNAAAVKIQTWYRKHLHNRQTSEAAVKAGEAAIKRLLEQKKQDIEDNKLDLHLLEEEGSEKKKVENRKRQREDKAKQARQQAIQELQKKREDKRAETKKKAEEEVMFLQASGKITKTPMHSNKKKKSPSKYVSNSQKDNNMDKESVSDAAHLTARSQDRHSEDDVVESVSNIQMLDTGRESNATADRTLVASEMTTKSTLNDLLETLKRLEEEEHLVTPKVTKKNAWLDDLEKDAQSGFEEENQLTADKLRELNHHRENSVGASGYLSDDKLKSIMSFLDEVQVADRISSVEQELNKVSHDFEIPAPLVPSADELADLEHAQAAANEVTSTVLSQRLDLEEKKRTVTMLQKALNQQRELTVRHAKETEKEMKKRLDVQKDEYEEAIKRHLSFIDQLIDDKKTLSEKCEMLVRELKTVDKKYQDKFKSSDEKHNIEIQKLKNMHEAAEKLRRERWIEDKTKKIKEMTVKGLEPEIQRLIAKHKGEIKKIKQIHEAELLESDERAAQRYVKMTEELRDQLATEKEAACARERELAKQRYEKELQNEEEAYQQQRRRLYGEVQEEKDRVASQASRQRIELDKLQRQLEDSHHHALNAMKSEFEKAREEQENRHSAELRDMQEKLRLEKESWEQNFLKRQDNWKMQKERELKDQVKRDRDKEIELVISRLEEDATSSREECQRAADNKIKRIRDKYEAEMKDLERSEMHALEKYNEMKAKLTEVEGENECLKVYMKQKDQEITQLQKLTDKMHQERDRVSDIIRQEFADRLVTTDEENKRLKNDMSEMKARHRIELDKCKDSTEEVRRQKDKELEEVHQRVKQAIVKKEEVVSQLRQQYAAAQKRADHLEGLLQQQRKQLLKK